MDGVGLRPVKGLKPRIGTVRDTSPQNATILISRHACRNESLGLNTAKTKICFAMSHGLTCQEVRFASKDKPDDELHPPLR